MTGALIRHRVLLWIATALLLLGGGLALAFILIGRESSRADGLANEANLRGNAVATLAGDVRALRAQVQAKGGTPVAPDPSKAVPSLSARAEVPVPIPGPAGPAGPPGPSGKPAPTLTPSPGPSGPSGPSGAPGTDSTVAGPVGPKGDQGDKGDAGDKGDPGSAGSPPAGWTFTYNGTEYTCGPVDGFDPQNPRYTCTQVQPSPSPSDSGLVPLSFAWAASRRRW